MSLPACPRCGDLNAFGATRCTGCGGYRLLPSEDDPRRACPPGVRRLGATSGSTVLGAELPRPMRHTDPRDAHRLGDGPHAGVPGE
jgi:ribosomal protein L40E